MRSKRNFFLLIAIIALAGVNLFFSAKDARADEYGLEETVQGTVLPSLSISKGNPETLAELIVQRALFFVGTVFFLLILYAGVSWMIAMGSTEKVNRAKMILETAIIGLLIVTVSYAISNYIFNKFTGAQQETTETTPINE